MFLSFFFQGEEARQKEENIFPERIIETLYFSIAPVNRVI